ncbi:hypothetical protein BD626DRAFT_496002, partial [Schizophyllum amplum]
MCYQIIPSAAPIDAAVAVITDDTRTYALSQTLCCHCGSRGSHTLNCPLKPTTRR